jgi:lysine 2,3-aminomutase
MIKSWHYSIIARIKNPYLVFHINHPNEITKDFLQVSDNFRKKCLALVLSQSVLLKGINDNQKILCNLFTQLTVNGIRPYYLHYPDPVPWADKYRLPLKDAKKLWHSLRPNLSGIAATAKFMIEKPGKGKRIIE